LEGSNKEEKIGEKKERGLKAIGAKDDEIDDKRN
jgi:hypothetical protein